MPWFCPRCGREYSDKIEYCPRCGFERLYRLRGYPEPKPKIKIEYSSESHWLANPWFLNPKLEQKFPSEGVYTNKRVELAPLNGDWKWGLRGYTWNGGLNPILNCAFDAYKAGEDDYNVKLWGQDDSGRWGVITLIQGWVWGGNPPADWYRPAPLPVSNKKNMKLDAWIWQQGGPFPWWHFYYFARNCLFDVWMKDSSGKILMMDLYFVGGGANWYDENSYHYAKTIATAPSQTWYEVSVTLDSIIDDAIQAAKDDANMDFDKNTLKIYQVEILAEVKYAWCDLIVGAFTFTYEEA